VGAVPPNAGYDVRVSDAYMDGDDDNEVVPALSKN
jgi:hypothetical protein